MKVAWGREGGVVKENKDIHAIQWRKRKRMVETHVRSTISSILFFQTVLFLPNAKRFVFILLYRTYLFIVQIDLFIVENGL